MIGPILATAAGFGLLYVGAEAMVRGAVGLSTRLGVSPLLVGLTLVAVATSSPELAVSVGAALAGKGDLALGNVVGSNIANVGLILGLTALVRPIRVQARLMQIDVPIAIACALLLVVLLGDLRIGRGEGILLLLGLAGYLALNVRHSRREPGEVLHEFDAAWTRLPSSRAALLLLLGGLGLLAAGSQLFVQGSVGIARIAGVSERVIGLTLVAVGTSLPELATSVVAALQRRGDLAVGNIVGSNIFNVLGILGPAALVRPLVARDLERLDLVLMVAITLALLPLMRTGFRLVRWEAALLLAAYAGYLAWVLG